MSGKNNNTATPKQNLIAAILMALLLAALAARLWFDYRASNLLGVALLSSTGDHVLAEINRQLHLLDRHGKLLDTVSLAELGIDGEIIDLQLLDRDTALLGDWDRHRLLRCNLPRRDCAPLPLDEAARPRGVFKFHLHRRQSRLLLTDTRDQVLRQVDLDSATSRALSRPRQFLYPSRIGLTDDGRLYVVDTNHQRLAVFDAGDASLAKPVLELRAADGQDKRLPISASPLPGGGWAVLFADELLGNAELHLFDRQGEQRMSPAIDGAADLRTLTTLGQALLVGDIEALRLFQVDPVTGQVQDFGGPQLQARLADWRQQKQSLSRLSEAMLALLIGLFVLAMILAVAVSRRQSGETGPAPRPLPRPIWLPARQFPAVVWVSFNPVVAKKLHWMLLGLIALIALANVFILLLQQESLLGALATPLPWHFSALTGVMLLFTLLLLWHFRTQRQWRIGSDGQTLYLMNARQQVLPMQPVDVVYNHYQLSYGPYSLNYRHPQNNLWLFDQQRFEDFIQPLLAQGREMSSISMAIYQLRHGNRLQVLGLVAIGLLLLGMYLGG